MPETWNHMINRKQAGRTAELRKRAREQRRASRHPLRWVLLAVIMFAVLYFLFH
jgi:hypothetical protein